ncbi:MAG: hypothetical protein Ct9H300mP27_07520 [Chloroflexota bacterium]|nr:MAG: hypothetical protein Ct9H300mP27_07520 [Chloroflexota bacterium]
MNRQSSYNFDDRWIRRRYLKPRMMQPLIHKFGEKLEFHPTEHSAYRDGLFAERWIAAQMGMAEPALPEHWQ